jgi:hypothetical protein
VSDILPPCELPSIGFGALPIIVGATSLAVAGAVLVIGSRGGRARVVVSVAVALLGVSLHGGSEASADGRPDCRTVIPNFAEVPPEDLIVSGPGDTVPGDESHGDDVGLTDPEPASPETSVSEP